MSKECLSISEARTKIGYAGASPEASSELVTKTQCLAMGAKAELLTAYASDDECPADDDILPGSLIVSLCDWSNGHSSEGSTSWNIDDMYVRVQGEARVDTYADKKDNQVTITGKTGTLNFYTDLTIPTEEEGGGWFIEYDMRNVEDGTQKTALCFSNVDYENPVSIATWHTQGSKTLQFRCLCLGANIYENMGMPFGDGDLMLPYSDTNSRYVLMVFLKDGGEYKLGVTTTDPNLDQKTRVEEALKAIKDDVKEPFVSAYPNRWWKISVYDNFRDYDIIIVDDLYVKNPEYTLPKPELGEPFMYGYDHVGLIVKSVGILKLR